MEVKDFKVLVVGCGSIGKRHTECLARIGVKNFIFFDPNTDFSNALAEQYGGEIVSSYEEGIEKCDVVYILSPTKIHIAQALIAAKAGKHIFMEKPLSYTDEGLDELMKIVEEKKLIVMVGFCFRFHAGVKRLYELMKSGIIGKVVSIRALMGEHFPTVRPDYLSTYYVKYSGAFELIHDLDLALHFAGEDVLECSGMCGSYAELGFESPDCVEILLRFNSCLANVHLDFFQSPRTRVFTLAGTQGKLSLEFADWNQCTVTIFTRQDGKTVEEHIKTERNDMFVDESLSFFDAVLGKNDNVLPLSEGKKSLEIYQQLCK